MNNAEYLIGKVNEKISQLLPSPNPTPIPLPNPEQQEQLNKEIQQQQQQQQLEQEKTSLPGASSGGGSFGSRPLSAPSGVAGDDAADGLAQLGRDYFESNNPKSPNYNPGNSAVEKLGRDASNALNNLLNPYSKYPHTDPQNEDGHRRPQHIGDFSEYRIREYWDVKNGAQSIASIGGNYTTGESGKWDGYHPDNWHFLKEDGDHYYVKIYWTDLISDNLGFDGPFYTRDRNGIAEIGTISQNTTPQFPSRTEPIPTLPAPDTRLPSGWFPGFPDDGINQRNKDNANKQNQQDNKDHTDPIADKKTKDRKDTEPQPDPRGDNTAPYPDTPRSPDPSGEQNPYPSNQVLPLPTVEPLPDASGNGGGTISSPALPIIDPATGIAYPRDAVPKEDKPTPKKCDDPCIQQLIDGKEPVDLSIKIFKACSKPTEPGQLPNGNDKIDFEEKTIQVPKSESDAYKILYERIFALESLQCNPTDAIAAVPEWWQVRIEGRRPQLVIQFAELKADGSKGSPKYALSIPHYLGTQEGKVSPISAYQKGSVEGILTLNDNSKVIINAIDSATCLRVLEEAKAVINPAMKDGAFTKIGQRRGQALSEIQVVPRSCKFFKQGLKDMKPDWSGVFN